MNSSVINPTTIRKLKKLSNQIEGLKELQSMLGLKLKEELKLNLKTEKLIKIIKGLWKHQH